jgi:S1-C subfamily serine protease
MKVWMAAALAAALVTGSASAADYKTLRNLNAPPAVRLEPLPRGVKARRVEFVKSVVAPKDGEAWGLAYYSISVQDPDHPRPRLGFLNWNSGRIEGDGASFARIFNEEAQKAGFNTAGGDSVFSDGESGADLKVGVLIDDLKGRFCVDCPNLFNRNGIPASVVMTAHWEIYSSLDRRVVAKVTTTGGADYKSPLQGNVLPAIFEGFRENARLLLANDDFRKLVTAPVTSAAPAAARDDLTPISLQRASRHLTTADAASAVAVIFAADGSGSGFLLSDDGYVITNHHVVGGSKYVKLKWSDGSEGLGEVIRSDARRDVAIIKTDAHGRGALDIRSGPVQQGETVFAIGSPLGEKFQNTMSKGIVSATRTSGGLSFIQSDVMINHGSSGGPLLDEKGRVIGLTVSGQIADNIPIGLNFFIPIDDALHVLGLTPPPEAPVKQAAAVSPAGVAKRR